MAQSISFGAYTIQLGGSNITVLDQSGQVVAIPDLATDATAKLTLPNGQVLDMGQLADSLASDHIADFATAAGGAGGGAAGGSGMFFAGLRAHNGLAGFDELQVLKPSAETPSSTPPAQPEQPNFATSGQQLPVTSSLSATPPVGETPVNHAPTAADGALAMAEDTVLHGSVFASDVEGDHLTYSLVAGPQHGSVSFNTDGTYTYTPTGDYNGADSFTYKASDGSLTSNTGTVNLTVTPVNDAPVADTAASNISAHTLLDAIATASDVEGDPLSYSLVAGPQHGSVSFNADGTYTYTPTGDYNGADSFTYKASDGSLTSNTGTVNLTVTPVNDAPTIAADSGFAENHQTQGAAASTVSTATFQPHVTIVDVDSNHLSSATIDTHGFVNGDSLHVGQSALFDVSITQTGFDYHISVTAKSGSETISHFEHYLNSITFDTSSNHEGSRTLDYTVTDDQHATSIAGLSTIDVHTDYDVWASKLAPNENSLGGGNDHLHLDAKLTGKFDMGDGDDTVSYEINNGTFNHQAAPNLQNVEHIDTTGFGTNLVSLSVHDVLDMTDGGHHLTIVGDSTDTVHLTGDNSSHQWQQTGSHDGFNVYTWSDPGHAAVVEISQIMHQGTT